jgi:hypothetical protein
VAGRGIDKVFDFLVSPDEQREVRRQAEKRVAGDDPLSAVRWCIGASAERPLACALAVDLAVALARSGRPTRILAGFERPPLLARSSTVPWIAFDLEGESRSLSGELGKLPEDCSAIVIIPSRELPASVGALPRGTLDGVLLAVDTAPWGLSHALDRLRPLGQEAPWMRVGAILLGARGGDRAVALFHQLERAARQQLQLVVERLGELQRDATNFESLLHGVSALDLDADAPSSRQVLALSRRLQHGSPSVMR